MQEGGPGSRGKKLHEQHRIEAGFAITQLKSLITEIILTNRQVRQAICCIYQRLKINQVKECCIGKYDVNEDEANQADISLREML